MYCISSCNPICFLKFIIHKMNSEMIKYVMVKLPERENADMADVDVVMGWMLYAAADYCRRVGGREGEKKLMWHDREGKRTLSTTGTILYVGSGARLVLRCCRCRFNFSLNHVQPQLRDCVVQ
jgi:hypothetical protein